MGLEGWASIVVNLLLFVIKILIGIPIKSVSLIADAVHTLADSATSGAVIIGFKIARKPSDKEHPFDDGRMVSVAAQSVRSSEGYRPLVKGDDKEYLADIAALLMKYITEIESYYRPGLVLSLGEEPLLDAFVDEVWLEMGDVGRAAVKNISRTAIASINQQIPARIVR